MIRKNFYKIHTILLWIIACVIPSLCLFRHNFSLANIFPGVLFANAPIVLLMNFLGNLLLKDSAAGPGRKEWLKLIIVWLPPAVLFYFTAFSKDPFAIFVNYILALPYLLLMFFIIKYFKDEHDL